MTYLEIYVQLFVLVELLVETLLVVVRQLKGQLGATHQHGLQHEAAQRGETHDGLNNINGLQLHATLLNSPIMTIWRDK